MLGITLAARGPRPPDATFARPIGHPRSAPVPSRPVSLTRRHFMQRSTAFAAGFVGLHRLTGCAEPLQARAGAEAGYGPLLPDPARVLELPEGFRYSIISRVGEEMDDGLLVPGLHDGMAAFPGPEGR